MSTATLTVAIHEMTDQQIRVIEAAEHGPILGRFRSFPGRFAAVGSDSFAAYCDFVRQYDLRENGLGDVFVLDRVLEAAGR